MISFKNYFDRREWYLDGNLHRKNGPGYKAWCQNYKLHRTDGPAIEFVSGNKEWYQKGKRHRIDGPAIEYADGKHCWFIDDSELLSSQIKTYQIQRLFSIALALSPLELPPYVVLWILEWSESAYISSLSPIAVVKMLEGIRNSRLTIKN